MMTENFEEGISKEYDFNKIVEWVNRQNRNQNVFFCDVPQGQNNSYYALGMFPYPSGNAHMGHVRVNTLVDVVARYQKAKGKSVINPMGWDAFGLPAENAAIASNIHPTEFTQGNIRQMKDVEFASMGWSFDWDKELNTSDPDYYRWSQWIFLQFYKHKKAYKKSALVNWCEVDKTVLANEQVIDGRCWRDGSEVKKIELEQWFLRLTDYSQRLWDDLPKLKNWAPEAVAVQRNWINKSTGTELDFSFQDKKISVFTTRADTLFGVTALVLAPEHPLVKSIIKESKDKKLEDYVVSSLKKSSVERMESTVKTGVPTGFFCCHPLTNKKIEIWIGDYVVFDYGTGAVMCVPAHDTRDFEFMKKFDLDIIEVVAPAEGKSGDLQNDAWVDDGVLINSDHFNGLSSSEAREKITARLVEIGMGRACTNYNLRDWSVGRQRYWGCPIPIIYCSKCGTVPVPEEDLPILLPKERDAKALEAHKKTTCPKCKAPAQREIDTLDTFICSSWYAYRFLDPHNHKEAFSSEYINAWMPIDFYVGGLEHAALHMIYFRFFTKFFQDIGLINFSEPVDHFFCNGMVCLGGSKMSKSKGNVITPTEIVKKYGSDALRLYILSDTPAEIDIAWNDSGIQGKYEFICRTYRKLSVFLSSINEKIDLQQELKVDFKTCSSPDVLYSFYGLLDQLNFTIREYRFHNSVAKLYELSHTLTKYLDSKKGKEKDGELIVTAHLVKEFIIAMGPFAPYFSEALLLQYFGSIPLYKRPWPKLETNYLERPLVTIVVQENGKKRGVLEMNRSSSKEEVEKAIKDHLGDKVVDLSSSSVVKTIYIADKIYNIVVKN